MKHALKYATLFLLGGLAGCGGLGEGNTIEKIEIVPATRLTQVESFEQGDTYLVPQCLRDEVIVLATFTDGSQVNFSRRATWSSSDPSVVQVSNGDIPIVLATNNPADDGSFYEHATVKYTGGTLIPAGTPGQTAVITAKFASLSASMTVEIRKPTLRIVRVPTDDVTEMLAPVPVAQDSTQRLAVMVELNGRNFPLADLSGTANQVGINPIRWVLTGATFEPQNDDVAGDIDRWVIRDGNNDPVVALQTTNSSAQEAVVTAYQAGTSDYEITAESYQCAASVDATLRPTANVRIGTFYDDAGTPATDERLALTREANFNGSGFAAEDLVMGTSHQLQVHASVDAGVDADGDGDPIEHVPFTSQAHYLALPVNGACTDADDLLGCTTNLAFSVDATGIVKPKTATTDGDVARVYACHPLCQLPTATLTADATAVPSGVTVNFTADRVDPPTGMTLNYVFDFGDGSKQGPQAGASASHAYVVDGAYTATVRVVDAAHPDEILSQNAGAARILSGVTPPVDNDAPVAELTVAVTTGDAPLSVALSAVGSSDSDSGDSITVYEFDPGDGTPVIRQTSATLVHVYRDDAGSPYTPTLRVYDESGVASAVVSDTTDGAITVKGTAPADIWSAPLDFRARNATLCSAALLPDAAAAVEPAFTFPSLQFQALGSFVANTATDTCADAVIGTQLITRFMFWQVRPQGDADTTSTIASIMNTADTFRAVGQVLYFEDVTADTVLDVTAVPLTPFTGSDVDPTPTTLTVQPCVGCTP